jgi:hypothetical protein
MANHDAHPGSATVLHGAATARIDSLRGTLQVARALVEAGRAIDLTGLDAEAARLCVAIGIMPDPVAHRLRPALEALRDDLDRLTEAFEGPHAA